MIYPLLLIIFCAVIIIVMIYKRNVINPVRKDFDDRIDEYMDSWSNYPDANKEKYKWVDQLIESL